MTPLLDSIHSPADVRQLSSQQLPLLAAELRQFLIESVGKTGGHFSSNLGTVELTVALHHVFNTPHDRLVWDVGHQTYPHKILTGRKDRMGTLRQLGGVAGFPKRDESEYDAFGTAHSSTSISAALGMALAAKQKGEQRHSVAIIGDGAMTAGMAFEAMNNAGIADCNLLVILNDNDMSISPPVGALNRYLAQLMSGRFYTAAKEVGRQVLKNAPPLFELARRLEHQTKGLLLPATLFEKFGFNYIGPIDGHDLSVLVPTLQNLKHMPGPQFLHVVTKKGQGYKLAEADPIAYHGPGKFDPKVGLVPPATQPKLTFSQVFGRWLCDMAEQDPRLVAITPAMREGSGMVEFHQRFPDRYHDVALQKLPMVLALDRAGIVGADGPTHAGVYDIPFLRCVPQVSIACPADENECRLLLSTAHAQDHTVAVRYPRGSGAGVAMVTGLPTLPFGKGELRRQGKGVALLVFGTLLYPALQAAETLNATVVNMRWAKPLDVALLLQVAATHEALVTLEEGAIMGGAGSAVMEALQDAEVVMPVLRLGVPDVFTDHGDPQKILSALGLDAAGIQASVQKRFNHLLGADVAPVSANLKLVG